MKKLIALVLAATMVLALLIGCSETSERENETPDTSTETNETPDASTETHLEQLTIATLEWQGLDLYQLGLVYPSQTLVAAPLFIMEEDNTFSPNVAESYTISDDGKTLTITLPEGMKYADGTDVTPDDLKRSMEWGMEISPYNADYSVIQSIETSGNDVILHMSSYSETMMYYLGSEFWPIIKASQIDTLSEEELLWKAETYGPYYVEEYVAGDHVTLKANPNYKCLNQHVENQGAWNVDTINVRFFANDFALIQAINAGEIDYSEVFSAAGVAEMSNDGMAVKYAEQPSVSRLLMNNDNDILSDERVREAIMFAIDREEMAENSDGGMDVAYAFSVSGMLDYSQEAEEYFKNTYCNDLDKAAALLAETGWTDSDGDGYVDKDGKKLELSIITRSSGATVEMLQIQLKRIGIQLNIEQVDGASYKAAIATDDTYELALASYSWGVTSSTLAGIVNDSNILSDDTYYSLCYGADGTPDNATRLEMLTQAEKLLMDTKCSVPLVRKNSVFVYNKSIENMVINNDGRLFAADVK